MRLVGSMTTLPDRLTTITEPIKHILRQSHPLDVLYLHIPLQTLKGKTYKIPEDFMDKFDGYPTKVVLNRCKRDYGPITKLAPSLELETDPNTYILTFDDDIIPNRYLVKTLYEKIQQYPNECLGFSGVCKGFFPFFFQFVIDNKRDIPVDWIQGVHVVAYKRSFFTTIHELITFGDDTPAKDSLLWNDDHRISSYLAHKNIPRISIGCNIQDFLFKYGDGQPDALSIRHADLVKEHFCIIRHFSDAGLYHRSYTITRSLLFLIVTGLSSGIATFLILERYKINMALRIVISILVIVIVGKWLHNSLAIKDYSPLLAVLKSDSK